MVDQATQQPESKKKLTTVIAVLLALILVLGVSIGAGFFGKGDQTPAPAAATADPHDHSQDIFANTTPAPAAEATATAPAPSDGTVNIDAVKAPRIVGSPDAPVKLVEYASLTCTHCAHFHKDTYPELKTKYIDTGLVSIEFREFPLNAAALDAAMIARCLPAERYGAYTDLLFQTQDAWTVQPDYIVTLKQNAQLAGLSAEQVDACLADPRVKQFIGQNVKDATAKWKIESTPTFIVNDGKEVIKGAMPLYEFERVFRVVSDGKVGALDKPEEGDKAAEPPAGEVPAEAPATP